jgi:hypothetical protein
LASAGNSGTERLGDPLCHDVVDLADMRNRILAGGRFEAHRPTRRDESVHPVATAVISGPLECLIGAGDVGAIGLSFAKRKPANAFAAGTLIDRMPPTTPFESFHVAFCGHACSVVVDLLMTVGRLRVPAGVGVALCHRCLP